MITLIDDLSAPVIDGVIEGQAAGQVYLFNPRGHHGVIPLSKEAWEVYTHCRNGLSIHEIKKALPRAKVSPWKLIDIITSLADCEILYLGREYSDRLVTMRAGKKVRQMSVWLQMTDSCNLRCSYCYISQRPTHMKMETAKVLLVKLIDECLQTDIKSFQFKFAGGEPSICWEAIRELIDWTDGVIRDRSAKAEYLLLTNGTRLPPDLIDRATSRRVKISISLDGVQQWHDKHRSYPDGRGSFRDVDSNIDKLIRRGVKPSISATITESNVRGLTELAEYCITRDLRFRFSPYRRPQMSSDNLKSDNEELIYELLRCYSWIENNLPSRSLYDVHRFADLDLCSPKIRICGVGKDYLAITSTGKVGLCQFDMDNPIGDALEENVVQLLQTQRRLPLSLNRVDLIPECRDCKWRYTCAGGCPYLTLNQYGVFRHSSPYCDVYKVVIPALLRLHALQLLRAGTMV